MKRPPPRRGGGPARSHPARSGEAGSAASGAKSIPGKPKATGPEAFVANARGALSRGDRDQALVLLTEAARLFPDRAAVQIELGNLALAAGNTGDAERAFRRAISLDPLDPAAHASLGNARREQGDAEDAIACYRRAAAVAPGLHPVWFNLGAVLREVGRYDEAIAAYRRALEIEPELAATWYNCANALAAAGLYGESAAAYDTALALRPGYAEAEFSKAITLLLDGQWAAGWDLYEARWRARTFGNVWRFAGWPQWQGEGLAEATLLVWGEQGIGDEIRFLSVLGEIADAVGSVLYSGEPRLQSLLARSWPKVRALSAEEAAGLVPAAVDRQSPVGSLPRHRRRSLSAFPPARPYLRADPGRVEQWQRWLGLLPAGRKLGISWRTGRSGRRKQARYAGLDVWAGFLSRCRGDSIVCLQYDDCDDEIAAFAEQHGVCVHLPPGLDRRDDFEGLAALYSALDVIVSAPNTVADLAGALGVPCWVPIHAPHWPWGIWPESGPTGQPWYANLTMVDARALGGWEAAFARIESALAECG